MTQSVNQTGLKELRQNNLRLAFAKFHGPMEHEETYSMARDDTSILTHCVNQASRVQSIPSVHSLARKGISFPEPSRKDN